MSNQEGEETTHMNICLSGKAIIIEFLKIPWNTWSLKLDYKRDIYNKVTTENFIDISRIENESKLVKWQGCSIANMV